MVGTTEHATKPQHWADELIALGGCPQRVPFVFSHRIIGEILKGHQMHPRQNPYPLNTMKQKAQY